MCSESKNIMWGVCDVCTLALTVAKTSSHYDRFAPVRPRLARWEYKRPQGAAEHWRKWGHIRGTFYTLYHFLVLDPN